MRQDRRARCDVMARREDRRHFKIPGLSKLRIGGSLGAATEKVKNTLNNTKILGVPIGAALGAATGGVGGLLAAESNRAGGDLGQIGKNLGQDITAGARNVPLALAGAGALGGGGALSKVGGLVKGAAGALSGLAGGGAGNLLDLGLGGLSAYNAAQLGKKSSDFAQGAYDQSQENWKQREPLRMAGIEGMLRPQQSQVGQQAISNLGGITSRNPFAAKPPLRMGGTV